MRAAHLERRAQQPRRDVLAHVGARKHKKRVAHHAAVLARADARQSAAYVKRHARRLLHRRLRAPQVPLAPRRLVMLLPVQRQQLLERHCVRVRQRPHLTCTRHALPQPSQDGSRERRGGFVETAS